MKIRENVEDSPRSGRPSISRTKEKVEHYSQKVHRYCYLPVRMIANELDMHCESVDNYQSYGDKEDLGIFGYEVAE